MKHMLGILRGAFFLSLNLCLVNCSSYTDDTKKIRSNFRSQQYAKALELIDKSSLRSSEQNRLLYLLEKSSILERLGESKESRSLLIEADKVVDRLYTLSISKEASTYLFNESSQAYRGEDYEKVAIHTMMAMSFLKSENISSARVEAKRINTRLNQINNEYDQKNRYQEDAFGRYLAGMIYEARDEWDSAIIDYKKALKAYEGEYRKTFETPVPKSLIQSLYRLLLKQNRTSDYELLKKTYRWLVDDVGRNNLGELIVIHQVGHVATKQRKEFVQNFGKQIVRFSFPFINPRQQTLVKKTGISSEGRPFISSQLAQNLDQIAAATLEDRKGRMLLKAGARLILKSQMAQEAEKRGGPILGLLFNAYGAVSETADTRQWTLLPSRVYVSRVRLKPGQHDVKVFTDGKLSAIESLNIKAGEIKFVIAF